MAIFFFFFNDTATTEIYTLSLHDALPISGRSRADRGLRIPVGRAVDAGHGRSEDHGVRALPDRKSTRLNSSHSQISYAVFCLKKKKNPPTQAAAAKKYYAHQIPRKELEAG